MNKALKVFLIILIYLLVYFFEFTLISSNNLFGIKPNLIIVAIVITSICYSKIFGILQATISGILLDIIYITNGIGIYTICYTLVGIILSFLIQNYIKNNVMSSVYLSTFITVIFNILQIGILLIGYEVHINIFVGIFSIILSCLLNGILTAILYNLISKFFIKVEKNSMYFN